MGILEDYFGASTAPAANGQSVDTADFLRKLLTKAGVDAQTLPSDQPLVNGWATSTTQPQIKTNDPAAIPSSAQKAASAPADEVLPWAASKVAPNPQPRSQPQAASQNEPDFSPTWQERVGNAVHGYSNGGSVNLDRFSQNAKLVYSGLIQRGIDPATAEAAARNPAVQQQALQSILAAQFAPKTVTLNPGQAVISSTTGQQIARNEENKPTELQANYAAAVKNGFKGSQLDYIGAEAAAKGKDINPVTQKAILDADGQVRRANTALDGVDQALELSKSAYAGAGAETRAAVMNGLPFYGGSKESNDTALFKNVVAQFTLPEMKNIFGARITNTDVNLFQKLQANADQPQAVREPILKQVKARITQLREEMLAEAEGLRGKTYFRPGGGSGATGGARAPQESADDISSWSQGTSRPAAQQGGAAQPQGRIRVYNPATGALE